MGLKDEKDEVLDEGRRGTRSGSDGGRLGGNGMRDVWVIGEGFFRGVGGVFDVSPPLSKIKCAFLCLPLTTVQTTSCRFPNILAYITRYDENSDGTCRDEGYEELGDPQASIDMVDHLYCIGSLKL